MRNLGRRTIDDCWAALIKDGAGDTQTEAATCTVMVALARSGVRAADKRSDSEATAASRRTTKGKALVTRQHEKQKNPADISRSLIQRADPS